MRLDRMHEGLRRGKTYHVNISLVGGMWRDGGRTVLFRGKRRPKG